MIHPLTDTWRGVAGFVHFGHLLNLQPPYFALLEFQVRAVLIIWIVMLTHIAFPRIAAILPLLVMFICIHLLSCKVHCPKPFSCAVILIKHVSPQIPLRVHSCLCQLCNHHLCGSSQQLWHTIPLCYDRTCPRMGATGPGLWCHLLFRMHHSAAGQVVASPSTH